MNPQPLLSIKHRSRDDKKQIRMDRDSLVIGRDQGNAIVLESNRISRNHAEIKFEGGQYFIVDLESGNGTYLNNQRLAPHEKVLLRSSDHIRIEEYDIHFQINGTRQPDFSEITDPDILEVRMIKKLLRTIDKDNVPVLEIVAGDQTGRRFPLEGKTQEVVIGRDAACEFRIDEHMVSRKHARLVKKWDTVTIIDLASKNGIYVNDERITEQVLNDGDRILLGTLPLVFRNPAEHSLDFLATKPPPQAKPAATPAEAEGGQEELSNLGARIARKVSRAGTEEYEARPAPAAEAPAEATPEPPTEAPSHAAEAAPPPPETALPPAEEEEPVDGPFWRRFSTLELAGAAVGVIILLGSIWLLLKLL